MGHDLNLSGSRDVIRHVPFPIGVLLDPSLYL